MGFDNIFRNRINLPIARPLLAQGGEQTIVWSAEASGLLARLEKLEQDNQQLQSRIATLEHLAANHSVDQIPGPVDATTFYETASDGTLRAGINVSVPSRGMFEVALFPEPTVKLATTDAIVDEDDPDGNYGSTSDLQVSNAASGQLTRSFVKVAADSYPDGYWDMPVIALLRLRLYGTPNEQQIFLRAITEDWAEETITWDNQPEVEDQVLDSEFVEEADTYSWFDVKPFLHRLRRRYDENNALAFFGFRIEPDESKQEGAVTWYSREGAPDDDSKPQLLYWFAPETSKICQGGTIENRLYGRPGGTYWFAYRMLDANNNPSAWSMPHQITLPSQGDTPPPPSSAPTIAATNFSNVKTIILDTNVPPDFAAYEVELKYDTTSEYLKTTANRFEYTFSSGSSSRTYFVRYRYVTRSGQVSSWGPWSSYIWILNELKIQRAEMTDEPAYILIDSDGDIHLKHFFGSSSKTYDYEQGIALPILHNVIKGVSPNNIAAGHNQVIAAGPWSTSNTYYTYLNHLGYTPPGSGTALFLFMVLLACSPNGGRFRIQMNDTVYIAEYGADTGQYTTIPLYCLMAGAAGTQHLFKVFYRSSTGATVTVYQLVMLMFDLGRL